MTAPSDATPANKAPRLPPLWRQARRLVPGSLAAVVIALAATFVSTQYAGPQLLYALLFGVALHHLSRDALTRNGIEFCGRHVLRFGVGLLGARITAAQIAGLGWQTALTVLAAIATTLVCAVAVGKRLRMTRAQSVLSGGAVAICGASAALAISAVLPREKQGDRFTLMVVVTVTVMSTLAMVLYPLAARMLQLPPDLAGLFLGGTIHDVAQVVGAGYMLDHATGDVATVVKLFRVSMLTVVVVLVSMAFKTERARAAAAPRPGASVSRQSLVPWFLWLFVGMVMLNSLGALPPPVQSSLNDLSRACLVVAIAALGMKTSFAELARAGWKPLALIAIETLWIAGFVLTVIVLRR